MFDDSLDQVRTSNHKDCWEVKMRVLMVVHISFKAIVKLFILKEDEYWRYEDKDGEIVVDVYLDEAFDGHDNGDCNHHKYACDLCICNDTKFIHVLTIPNT